MILLIDNYDSFTYNLVHYVEELGHNVQVYRNDKISLKKIAKLNPKKIIISPGPCTPNEAGICLDLVKRFYDKMPILGVCLGHQSIGQAFGAKIIKASKIMHGKTSKVSNLGSKIFKGLPTSFEATRYHSLVIKNGTLPKNFRVISETIDNKKNVIMGIEHENYPCYGVQFHPESIASVPFGKKIMKNFLNL
jgi:anthranilate synthase/aminodeoxychorismate synthase-like glutamine amidotransferase|tara:strand:- start:4 stop:579 length:576 start_codon:yes stop_codon:yes gene_type:complete